MPPVTGAIIRKNRLTTACQPKGKTANLGLSPPRWGTQRKPQQEPPKQSQP